MVAQLSPTTRNVGHIMACITTRQDGEVFVLRLELEANQQLESCSLLDSAVSFVFANRTELWFKPAAGAAGVEYSPSMSSFSIDNDGCVVKLIKIRPDEWSTIEWEQRDHGNVTKSGLLPLLTVDNLRYWANTAHDPWSGIQQVTSTVRKQAHVIEVDLHPLAQ